MTPASPVSPPRPGGGAPSAESAPTVTTLPARLPKVTLMRPWRGAAPSPETSPVAAAALQQACARWVSGMFVVMVLTQRFATPGQPDLALLVPIAVVWVLWGLGRGVVELDRTRLKLWLAATGAAAVLVPVQLRLVSDAHMSITSWGLFFAVWLPAVVRLKDRRRATFLMALRQISYVAAALAVGCLIFSATQLTGVLPYHDYMADIFPRTLLLQDFVISYPVVYESALYRANAWIGLEPSFVSMQLGIGLIGGFLSGTRLWVLVVIIGGLVAATAGSGLAIAAVAFAVMLGYPVRNNLVRYLPLAVGGVIALVVTPFGQSILARLTEAGDQQSSTSLRGILPYTYVWPYWTADPMNVIFGMGPSSSQTIVGESGILGLLTPSPVKIFVEYGVIVGAIIAVFLLFCYVGGPSRSLSVTLLVSLWMLQPGTTTILAVLPLFITTTWWSPRVDPVLESDTETFAAARGWLDRAGRWRPMQKAGGWRIGRRRQSPSPSAAEPTSTSQGSR